MRGERACWAALVALPCCAASACGGGRRATAADRRRRRLRRRVPRARRTGSSRRAAAADRARRPTLPASEPERRRARRARGRAAGRDRARLQRVGRVQHAHARSRASSSSASTSTSSSPAGSVAVDGIAAARGRPALSPTSLFVAAANGPREVTLERPARATSTGSRADYGQGVAGLATYAYRRLGWRTRRRHARRLGRGLERRDRVRARVLRARRSRGRATRRCRSRPESPASRVAASRATPTASPCSDRALSVTPDILDALARRGTDTVVLGPEVVGDADLVRHVAEPRGRRRRVLCARRRARRTCGRTCATTPRRIPGTPSGEPRDAVVMAYRNAVEARAAGVRAGARRSLGRRRRLRAGSRACDTTLLGVPVRMDAQPPGRGLDEPRAPRARSGLGRAGAPPVQSVPGVDQSIGGLVPASYVPTSAGEAVPAGPAAAVGEVDQPAIVHVKRVPVVARRQAAGAQPAADEDRRHLGLDRERGAGSAQARASASARSARRRRRPPDARDRDERLGRGLDDHRLGGDAEPPLDRERRAREQPARVAPAGARCSRPRAAAPRPRARASQAPSSTAAQSCSDPENGTSTGPGRGAGRRPGSRHRMARRRAARAGARPRAGRRARRRRAARRPARPPGARGRAPGVTEVNAAVRAVTPPSPSRSRNVAQTLHRVAELGRARRPTWPARARVRSPAARRAPSATSAGSAPSPNAAA